jgi:hypothetical protein
MASVVVPTAASRKASAAEPSLSLAGQRPSLSYRAVASVSISLLFVLVYGGSNFVASRLDTGFWFYSWELRIPFVPLLILPYLSIDLFFVGSFFLCANRTELHTHCRRIAMAILAAGVCFILFPLSSGYPAPAVDGWTGNLFRFLWSFDRPHNLVPSLHVALLSLLWPIYIRHTSGVTRAFVHIWFGLIFLSPLLTWQHHIADIVTGAVLGQFCIFAFPNDRRYGPNNSASANTRVAVLYAAGSISVFVSALALGGWWFLLLWPCISLAAVAVAYFQGDSAIFRKSGGRIPISSRVVLGPYLFGVYLRVVLYRRRRADWLRSTPGVICGRLPAGSEARVLIQNGVTAVLDLTAEHSAPRAFRNLDYLNIAVLDLTQPGPEQLAATRAFLADRSSRGRVYVHCALGISRSRTVVSDYIATMTPQQCSSPNRNPADSKTGLKLLQLTNAK